MAPEFQAFFNNGGEDNGDWGLSTIEQGLVSSVQKMIDLSFRKVASIVGDSGDR